MPKFLSLLLLHLSVSLGCIGSMPPYLVNQNQPPAASAARSKALHAPHHSFMTPEARAMKCQRQDFGIYRAAELRKLASLYQFRQDRPSANAGGGHHFSCGFDSDMETCAWYGVALTPGVRKETASFRRARFESFFDLDKFDCTSDRSFPFDDFFLLLGPNQARADHEASGVPSETVPEEIAAALEARIPCQLDRAVLKFDYWANNETPIIKICVLLEHSNAKAQCEEAKMDSNPLTFEIPPSAIPFRLRIQVENVGAEDIVFIDNLLYEGNICTGDSVMHRGMKRVDLASSLDGQRVQKEGKQSEYKTRISVAQDWEKKVIGSEEDQDRSSVCDALTCGFNSGDLCSYLSMGIGATAEWRIGITALGNPHTGLHKPNPNENKISGFAYVGLDNADLAAQDIYVLESPRFSIDRSAYLVFDLFQRSVGPQLRVCINNFKNCPYANRPLDRQSETSWVINQRVLLKKSAEKVFFVAGRLKRNLFLAIDNVRIESLEFEEYCVNSRR